MKKLFQYIADRNHATDHSMPAMITSGKQLIVDPAGIPKDIQPGEIRYAYTSAGDTTEQIIFVGVAHAEPAWFYIRHNFVRDITKRIVSLPLSIPVESDPGNDVGYLDFALFHTLTHVRAKALLNEYQSYKYIVKKQITRRRRK